MTWTIEFAPQVENDLRRLGRPVRQRIAAALRERIAPLADPRDIGAPLVGEWTGYWRYRIGDYRLIARIEDERVVILIVRIAHRRDVYRR